MASSAYTGSFDTVVVVDLRVKGRSEFFNVVEVLGPADFSVMADSASSPPLHAVRINAPTVSTLNVNVFYGDLKVGARTV